MWVELGEHTYVCCMHVGMGVGAGTCVGVQVHVLSGQVHCVHVGGHLMYVYSVSNCGVCAHIMYVCEHIMCMHVPVYCGNTYVCVR